MRNRSDQILDQWDADQEAQNNLAMASTIDMHMGQMFPNRKAAQDLAQRMAGVNTAGNFLRDLGAARLGTTQAARMGRVDPAEMLREKLVGSMTDRLGQVGKQGGPGSMADVFSEFNPAMSLMGGQPYEPRQNPMAAMNDRGSFARMLALIAAQNGQSVDMNSINSTADSLFGGSVPQDQQQGVPSVGSAAAAIRSIEANPLLSALGIMPGSSAQDIESVIQGRMAPESGSPLSPDDLRKLADYARNKRAIDPEWGKNIKSDGMFAHQNLSELLNLAPGKDPVEAIRAVQDRNKQQRAGNSKRFQENPNSLMDYLRLMWGP